MSPRNISHGVAFTPVNGIWALHKTGDASTTRSGGWYYCEDLNHFALYLATVELTTGCKRFLKPWATHNQLSAAEHLHQGLSPLSGSSSPGCETPAPLCCNSGTPMPSALPGQCKTGPRQHQALLGSPEGGCTTHVFSGMH